MVGAGAIIQSDFWVGMGEQGPVHQATGPLVEGLSLLRFINSTWSSSQVFERGLVQRSWIVDKFRPFLALFREANLLGLTLQG